MIKDKYNPVTEADLKERESFDALGEEERRQKINRLHEQALIENSDSFYKRLEAETDVEGKEDLELALRVCEKIKEQGGLALVVGGFARDAVLAKFGYNLKPKDIDIEVYGIEFDRLKEILVLLGEVNIVGRDSKTGAGHKDFEVEGDPNMTVKEAAKRRDFTINALALDPLNGEILDFYGGVEDIKSKTLRATDEGTFVEDPLRVLRGMQFTGRFGFDIDQSTKELCRTLNLKELSKERIGDEWMKLLMKAPKPSVGLEWALELGVLDQLHPEIKALIGVPQNPEYHPEGDVWIHTKMVVGSAAELAEEQGLGEEEKKILMLAAICHDLGKPLVTKEEGGRIISHGHEDAGLEPAQKFLEMLYIKKDLTELVLRLVKEHMFIHNNPEPTDSAIRKLAGRVHPGTIKQLAILATADKRGTGLITGNYDRAENVLKKAEELAVQDSKPKPLIMGRDLLEVGFRPGIKVGEVLEKVKELQLEGEITTPEEARDFVRVELHVMELKSFGLEHLLFLVFPTRLFQQELCVTCLLPFAFLFFQAQTQN